MTRYLSSNPSASGRFPPVGLPGPCRLDGSSSSGGDAIKSRDSRRVIDSDIFNRRWRNVYTI